MEPALKLRLIGNRYRYKIIQTFIKYITENVFVNY